MINREVKIKSVAKNVRSRADGPIDREKKKREQERRETCEIVEREIRLFRPHEIRVMGEV